jgi:hypothetical protein
MIEVHRGAGPGRFELRSRVLFLEEHLLGYYVGKDEYQGHYLIISRS